MTNSWHPFRRDFPVTDRWIYLDHASGGPMARPVYEKVLKYYREHQQAGDLPWSKWLRQREEVREKVARFIHAEAGEVAFTQNASQGMNLIAEALAAEGAVLTNTCEFPSSTLPWLWRKAKVIYQMPERGSISLAGLKGLLSPSVKTIVTSFVQYATGFRQNLEALGKLKGGRFLVVNAAQGFGALPVDVRRWQADFLCTNSHKWLLAGYGGGILFIRKKWLSKFKPAAVGWRSMRRPEVMDNRKLDLRKDASRYELGCPDFPTIFAIGAAVDYLSAIGIQRIERRILELTDFAIQGLLARGFDVLSPLEKKFRSGIVVFRVQNAEKICRGLLRKKIVVSPRGGGIRIAPHFYNTFEEIDIFLNAVE